jgi:flagellin
MTSVLTNNAATAALQTLRSISQSMADTQNRISSGARVDTAADNAAYWAIATTMKSDVKAIGAISDALGMGAAKVDTAYAGMEAAIDIVTEIKKKVVASKEEGVDKTKIQEEITQLQEQLKAIGTGSSFNGENWLVNDGSVTSASVVSGFVRDSAGNVSVKTSDYALNADSLLYTVDATTGDAAANSGILNRTDVTDIFIEGNATAITQIAILELDVTGDDLDEALASVEWALSAMTTAASTLGSMSSRIDLQSDFANNLSDALTKGLGRLVDADMNEESTKLKALQTQQQLAIQALSIANNDSQNILSLFRG